MTQTTPNVTLSIPEMDCPIEEGAIRKALDAAGHQDVTLNVMTREAQFKGDEDKRSAVIDAIAQAGFEAMVAKSGVMRYTLSIPEMDCPIEEKAIRDELVAAGIDGVQLNVITRTALFQGDEALCERVIAAVAKAGFEATPMKRRTNTIEAVEIPYLRFGMALLIAFLSEALDLWGEYHPETLLWSADVNEYLSLALAAVSILMAGLGTLKEGLKCLLHFEFNMSTLMAVAVIGAVVIGAWPEAAMVMVLFEISELIEDLCMTRARRSIRDLMAVTPTNALVIPENGKPVEMPVADIAPGTRIRVAPGDRFPLDGVIETGSTLSDQSNVTGESLPVEKNAGDTVWSGTVNLSASVDVRVTAAEADSLTARIIEAVENAQATKSPVQRFVDKFAAIYTPIVFILAIAVALVPPMIGGDWMGWLYKAFCLLVIACPCALVISTPVTIVSALATATRCGLLIKGGLYLEQARHLRFVGLDKTGTLTQGEPSVQVAKHLAPNDPQRADILALSLAAMNKHPLSYAITRYAKRLGYEPLPVTNFKALPGVGVEGVIGGVTYQFVKPAVLDEDDIKAEAQAYHNEGMSVVVLRDPLGPIAYYALRDEEKANVAQAIDELKQTGLTPVLLTGDNHDAAKSVAQKVRIDSVKANLLPEEKLRAIEAMQTEGLTAMVGDGINDAPALARADIGIAMGIRGTDSAIEAAHVAVMDDDIRSIATLVRLSRITHRVLVQNIVFAISIKLVFMALTFAGLATMWMAVFADTGTCLIVVANGMRMLRMKDAAQNVTANR